MTATYSGKTNSWLKLLRCGKRKTANYILIESLDMSLEMAWQNIWYVSSKITLRNTPLSQRTTFRITLSFIIGNGEEDDTAGAKREYASLTGTTNPLCLIDTRTPQFGVRQRPTLLGTEALTHQAENIIKGLYKALYNWCGLLETKHNGDTLYWKVRTRTAAKGLNKIEQDALIARSNEDPLHAACK